MLTKLARLTLSKSKGVLRDSHKWGFWEFSPPPSRLKIKLGWVADDGVVKNQKKWETLRVKCKKNEFFRILDKKKMGKISPFLVIFT